MEHSPQVNLLKYAPEKLTVEIMMKYPPKDIIDLYKSKDKRVRELCKDFLSRKDYQKRWGGVPHHETYKKEDLKKLEKDVNVIEPNLDILITNLKNQPTDIQKMILLKTDVITFLAVCSVKDNAIKRLCNDKNFIQRYYSLYKDDLYDLLGELSSDGEYELLKELLTVFKNHVDPSASLNEAIRFAAYGGHYKIVKLLLKDPRVDPNDYSEDRDDSALLNAIKEDHYKIVELLLKDPRTDPSIDENEALRFAAHGYYESVKLLLKDPRVDPRARNTEAIFNAIDTGHTEIVELLLKDDRVDPSVEGNYAIQLAAEKGLLEIVKLLLEDPRVDPTEALEYAEANGREDIIKIIKKHLEK